MSKGGNKRISKYGKYSFVLLQSTVDLFSKWREEIAQ